MRLAKELAVSSSHVCKLQQEVDGLQQRVTELQGELKAVRQESQSRSALVTCLESKVEGKVYHWPSGCLLIKLSIL